MLRKYFLFAVIFLCYGITVAQTIGCACCSENHTNFDFWIGSWNVVDVNGTPVGTNTITKEEGNCLLREHWVNTNGQITGTSMNFYNLQTKQWEQLWIDNSGLHLKLKGNRVGNQMILSSDEFKHTDGNIYVNRITWTINEDGSVRQLWEVLQKDKVMSIAFDGLYKKAN